MYNPVATYRLQFHKDFTFQNLEGILLYLHKLGITTVYASPVFKAVPGSAHGYDVLDPNLINPEIGAEEQLRAISQKAKEKGMGWLQDVVPNHMAYDTRNPWVFDMLEKGPQSLYAAFFDETWAGKLYEGRIMVPFLGKALAEVIKSRELAIVYKNQRFGFNYYDTVYPLHPHSYATILAAGKHPQAIQQLLLQVESLKKIEEKNSYAERWHEVLLQLEGLMRNKLVRTSVDETLSQINNNAERLQQIAAEQSYRLCHWQETDGQINYRRFFTVNGLICLNIQTKEVLEEHHRLIKAFIDEGIFQGLRIDHIDGLYNPTQYVERLRRMAGPETYIVVEKILEPGEGLPCSWPIQGTTGYDFLALVNNLLTQKESEQAFTQLYQGLVKDDRSIAQQIREKKAYILYHHMGGELENLYRLFMESGLVSHEDYTQMRTEDIKTALAEFLIHCPVYRYYGNCFPLADKEQHSLQNIFQQAKASRPDLSPAVALLEELLLHRAIKGDEAYREKALHFYQRCMQFAGPLMAKGIEDTLMYTYNRFVAHNEVGGSPESFGLSIREFHEAMKQRQRQWPLSLNATSTHDTKRGEDARARLNVLSDLPNEWNDAVKKWQQLNASLKSNGVPDANDEYFIYQTLVASYPFPNENEEGYGGRLQAYIEKALREAKTHSNWTAPNETYESATKKFALGLLDNSKPFWKSFQSFQQKIIDFGIINSLSQTILKSTCPGVPDVYQGCEVWNFSFVDPDNRRAVDYESCKNLLESIEQQREQEDILQQLWRNRYNGGIKLWFTQALLHLRKEQTQLFAKGEYIPLKAEGRYACNIFAFIRKHHRACCMVVIPLHLAQLGREQEKDILAVDWQDTKVILPSGIDAEWENVLLCQKNKYEKEVPVQQVFQPLPFALLKGKTKVNQRAAGVLLHITSLPSAFGIGDFGPEAYVFADFLGRSYQRYWQLLPLNPIDKAQGYSPYSSVSSRAGNLLLISPELLVKDGLLDEPDLSSHRLPEQGKAVFEKAGKIKEELLGKAFENYKTGNFENLKRSFQQFCEKEKEWLDDFALYILLKQQHHGRPWYEWAEDYKKRDPKALGVLVKNNAAAIEKTKWIQFVFDRQWEKLKTYCNDLGIQLVGDLPFYVSYDSADVWTNPDFFSLDEEGHCTAVAGVPPDAFSADGQLWGMPVYRWDALKEQGYSWWIDRLKKNRGLFDIIRLDHFRAFAAYWEVPAGASTAKNGQWKQGPGQAFFNAVKEHLSSLPFLAEDLGDVDETIFQLRDEFHLPGMKVLQFAFDENMPCSHYIPHNYTQNFFVYTGTHDNDTTLGWYQSVDDATRQRLQHYAGKAISKEEIAFVMCCMAYGSVANVAILPLQDVLGLDTDARLNTPSSPENNWAWRLLPGQIDTAAEERLGSWTELFNRR